MFIVFCLNVVLVSLAVVVHYESVRMLTNIIPNIAIKHRVRIVIGVLGCLLAHSIEIWLFGIGYYFAQSIEGLGGFEGTFDGSLLDCAYFSFTTYTTLGFGDIAPLGHLRFIVGLESLTGLVLITWTASFLFVEMQTYWMNGKAKREH